jgi:hypothetical protein
MELYLTTPKTWRSLTVHLIQTVSSACKLKQQEWHMTWETHIKNQICQQILKGFYIWVLHPVAHLSNWFLVTPSIATKFQYVNSFLFSFLLTTSFGPYGPSSGEIYKHLIVYLTWRWPVGAETCSEWRKIKRGSDVLKLCCDWRNHKEPIRF